MNCSKHRQPRHPAIRERPIRPAGGSLRPQSEPERSGQHRLLNRGAARHSGVSRSPGHAHHRPVRPPHRGRSHGYLARQQRCRLVAGDLGRSQPLPVRWQRLPNPGKCQPGPDHHGSGVPAGGTHGAKPPGLIRAPRHALKRCPADPPGRTSESSSRASPSLKLMEPAPQGALGAFCPVER